MNVMQSLLQYNDIIKPANNQTCDYIRCISICQAIKNNLNLKKDRDKREKHKIYYHSFTS